VPTTRHRKNDPAREVRDGENKYLSIGRLAEDSWRWSRELRDSEDVYSDSDYSSSGSDD
jgi:hypothetical protein